MSDFQAFPKIARWSRDIVITEKIDGTNGQVLIRPDTADPEMTAGALGKFNGLWVWAGSRSRWLAPGQSDNHGFGAWVMANAERLVAILGEGRHFGEWWGEGIQRQYGIKGRRFSLFNAGRWAPVWDRQVWGAVGLDVVPVLYEGPLSSSAVEDSIARLGYGGSLASPGFMRPEGVVIYHTAAGVAFKKTLERDEAPKGVSGERSS